MSFFTKLKDRLFRSSDKIGEGLESLVAGGDAAGEVAGKSATDAPLDAPLGADPPPDKARAF